MGALTRVDLTVDLPPEFQHTDHYRYAFARNGSDLVMVKWGPGQLLRTIAILKANTDEDYWYRLSTAGRMTMRSFDKTRDDSWVIEQPKNILLVCLLEGIYVKPSNPL